MTLLLFRVVAAHFSSKAALYGLGVSPVCNALGVMYMLRVLMCRSGARLFADEARQVSATSFDGTTDVERIDKLSDQRQEDRGVRLRQCYR